MSAPENALPVTGGIATGLFSVIGLALVGIGALTRRIARIGA
jgi:LPXTG-motif cell wall-anchored protein